MENLKLALIEDNPRYRSTLRDFFRLASGFELTAVYGSAEALLSDVSPRLDSGESLPWQMAMMDIELPG